MKAISAAVAGLEADENYTAALDLKITPELRQSCMARELGYILEERGWG